VIEAGFRVVPVPGPSALLAALVASGLPAVPFSFFGFFPRSGRERRSVLTTLGSLQHTAIIYESPQRLADTLDTLVDEAMGERRVAVSRELTKKFEETRRGSVAEVAGHFRVNPARGEIVIVLGSAEAPAPDEAALGSLASEWRTEGIPAREIARRLSEEHGAPRNLAYRLAHE